MIETCRIDDCQKRLLVAEIETLRHALTGLVEVLPKIEAASSAAFAIASVHGCPYRGPNWKRELEAAREALPSAHKDDQP